MGWLAEPSEFCGEAAFVSSRRRLRRLRLGSARRASPTLFHERCCRTIARCSVLVQPGGESPLRNIFFNHELIEFSRMESGFAGDSPYWFYSCSFGLFVVQEHRGCTSARRGLTIDEVAARVSYTVETTVLPSFALPRESCSGVSMSAGWRRAVFGRAGVWESFNGFRGEIWVKPTEATGVA